MTQILRNLAVLAIAVVVAFGGMQAANILWPTRPAANSRAIGVADGLLGLPPDQLDAELDGIAALGVRWVRLDIQWHRVQPERPGAYDWAETDRIVQALLKHNLQPVAMVSYTPVWARLAECERTAMCAPYDPDDYGRFVAAAAGRYKASIQYWELWNEPNTKKFFEPGADPDRYANMLKAAYPRIKDANSAAIVITGGTAPATTPNDGDMLATDFLRALYDAGAQQYFDAVAHHPYTNPASPAKSTPYDGWGQLASLHNIMAAHSDGGKLVWATKYGFPTGGSGNAATARYPEPGSADHVTEARQADLLSDALSAYRNLPWAGPIFWYTYRDTKTGSSDTEDNYGLIRTNGQPKPAYNKLRDLAKNPH